MSVLTQEQRDELAILLSAATDLREALQLIQESDRALAELSAREGTLLTYSVEDHWVTRLSEGRRRLAASQDALLLLLQRSTLRPTV